jgi:hypothetical protein
MGTLHAFEIRYDVPVVFCETPKHAARQIERWVFYFAREIVQIANDLRRGIGQL